MAGAAGGLTADASAFVLCPGPFSSADLKMFARLQREIRPRAISSCSQRGSCKFTEVLSGRTRQAGPESARVVRVARAGSRWNEAPFRF